MICKKCGAPMPDNAKFCGKCGATAPEKGNSSAALIKAHREAKRYKIMSFVLAIACVLMGIGWAITAHDPVRSVENYESDAVEMERAGVELSGTYVVGEDEELPAGRYNIYPADGESYMSVYIYATKEAAKERYDKDYNSLAEDDVYRITRGYKLKAGQVVVIDPDSAYFELVSESTPADSEEASDESESADTLEETQNADEAAETE